MENASKALLIAGSVLIAIVLIAVGLKILSSTSGITNEVEGLSTTMEASIFNSQFTQYEGNIKGTQLKSLLQKILVNNKNGDKKIEIYLMDIDEFSNCTSSISKEEDINDTIKETISTKTYNVSITEYDDKQGYVKKIKIDEKQE